MTVKWLASVQSLAEAQQLSAVLPDIMDMKDPSRGALGALPAQHVAQIVDYLDRRCLTSATVGDLAMLSEEIIPAITTMAETGVDYVKVGLFPDANLVQCIAELKLTLSSLSTPVIAVLFADKMALDPALLQMLKQAGFYGVMVDTAIKNGQHLQQHWSSSQLKQFVELAKQLGLMTGLAGSLRYQDIDVLKGFAPDYLGFRSALCDQQQRQMMIQSAQAQQIQQAMTQSQILKKAI